MLRLFSTQNAPVATVGALPPIRPRTKSFALKLASRRLRASAYWRPSRVSSVSLGQREFAALLSVALETLRTRDSGTATDSRARASPSHGRGGSRPSHLVTAYLIT